MRTISGEETKDDRGGCIFGVYFIVSYILNVPLLLWIRHIDKTEFQFHCSAQDAAIAYVLSPITMPINCLCVFAWEVFRPALDFIAFLFT